MFRLWERWGASLGVLGILLWVVAFIIDNGSPSAGDSDAKITAWYASSSDRHREIVAFFIFIVGALCVLSFWGALRERLADAEDSPARISQLAFGAGFLSVALEIVAIALFVGPAFTVADASPASVAPDTFRVLNDTGYLVWVSATMIGAIAVWASSAIALRRAVFPRWFAWLSVVVGLAQLFAVFFFPILLAWAWILVAGLLLTWKRSSDPVIARTTAS
jgi:hypothetical protein